MKTGIPHIQNAAVNVTERHFKAFAAMDAENIAATVIFEFDVLYIGAGKIQTAAKAVADYKRFDKAVVSQIYRRVRIAADNQLGNDGMAQIQTAFFGRGRNYQLAFAEIIQSYGQRIVIFKQPFQTGSRQFGRRIVSFFPVAFNHVKAQIQRGLCRQTVMITADKSLNNPDMVAVVFGAAIRRYGRNFSPAKFDGGQRRAVFIAQNHQAFFSQNPGYLVAFLQFIHHVAVGRCHFSSPV